jgi:hypothetical protein
MPKITVHGGPSNRHEPQPRPGEGVFFQPPPGADIEPADPVEVPLGSGEALPPIAEPAAESETVAEAEEPTEVTEQPVAEPAEEPASKARARRRERAQRGGAAPVEGS